MNNQFHHKVLIVVAHTDDETIGLGGTIVKHVKNGDQVYALSMTDGVGARDENNKNKLESRLKASITASKVLGFKWLEAGNFPDNAMDSVPLLKIIKVIEKAKDVINPTLIYTHSAADLNVDHRLVSQATLTAFRPEVDALWKEIRAFEIASATDFGHKSITTLFHPNLYINIADSWEIKLKALKAYNHEIRKYPHSRSYKGIENLAKYRGNQIGLDYAEAFEILRKVER